MYFCRLNNQGVKTYFFTI